MPDLSNLLGTLYGSTPDAPEPRREASADERRAALEEAAEAHGGDDESEDEVGSTLSSILAADMPKARAEVRPEAAVVVEPAFANWSAPTVTGEAIAEEPMPEGMWRSGDDDIFPSAKASKPAKVPKSKR